MSAKALLALQKRCADLSVALEFVGMAILDYPTTPDKTWHLTRLPNVFIVACSEAADAFQPHPLAVETNALMRTLFFVLRTAIDCGDSSTQKKNLISEAFKTVAPMCADIFRLSAEWSRVEPVIDNCASKKRGRPETVCELKKYCYDERVVKGRKLAAVLRGVQRTFGTECGVKTQSDVATYAKRYKPK